MVWIAAALAVLVAGSLVVSLCAVRAVRDGWSRASEQEEKRWRVVLDLLKKFGDQVVVAGTNPDTQLGRITVEQQSEAIKRHAESVRKPMPGPGDEGPEPDVIVSRSFNNGQ